MKALHVTLRDDGNPYMAANQGFLGLFLVFLPLALDGFFEHGSHLNLILIEYII